MGLRRFIIAVLIAIVGSLLPAISVVELYQLPFGTELRPMHLGIELLLFGLGTPLCVVALVLKAQFDAAGSHSIYSWFLLVLAILLSLIPIGLLIPGVRWIVESHNLYFKP